VVGGMGGPALSAAQFRFPCCVALDTTDAVAGPQLMIGESNGVRALHLRSGIVSRIAGGGTVIRPMDGPALSALLQADCIAVAPSGVLYVSSSDPTEPSVRRISAGRWPQAGGPPPERVVTTLIGLGGRQFARAVSRGYWSDPKEPCGLALYSPPNAPTDGDDDDDVGRLYVACRDGVYALDLATGHKVLFSGPDFVSGPPALALTADGAHLFAVTRAFVFSYNTRTGEGIAIYADAHFEGPVIERYSLIGCVIDEVTRSLVMTDSKGHGLVRLRGVEV
jgi:hypothetical protein